MDRQQWKCLMVKTKNMKLSVIVPVYNVEKYIDECVVSILHQGLSEDEFEIILVNDGSTDSSMEICETLERKYKFIKLYNQPNKGQSSARNLGLFHAKGDYVFFVDSDDYLTVDFLRDVIDLMYEKSLDFFGFEYELTSKRFDISEKKSPFELLCKGDGLQLLRNHHYNNGPCWYIFKKSIIGNLIFEEDRLCEDGIFTAQLMLKINNGEIYNNKLYHYFINPESTVKTVNKERQSKINRDMFYAANRFKDIINQLPLSSFEDKAYIRLKERQESYSFFAIIRFLKSQKNYLELLPYLNELKSGKFPAYPMNFFKGYTKKDKVLVYVFNNSFLLKIAVSINKLLNILK